MKKILLLLSICMFLSISSMARTYVLVTGVSSYQNSQMNLSQTTKDAKEFSKVIETQTKDVTLLTSKYANKENILEKLQAICNRAGENDRIVFFYSGHGGRGGLYVYDGFLLYLDIINTLNTSKAKEKFVFIDACNAGSVNINVQVNLESTSLNDDAEGTDITFMVSSRGDEYSMEGVAVGASFFTQALLKGMRGKADDNGDKLVTIKELFKYVYNDVTRRTKSRQHPQLIAPKEMIDVVVMDWTK